MLKKFQTSLIIGLFYFALGGCSHPAEVQSGRHSLIEVQKIVESNLPAGRRSISENRREFTSNYFVSGKSGDFVPAGSEPVRYVANILVLGDRRPYTIQVRVFVEKRQSNGHFEQSGQDEGLARVILRRIEKALYQRREDRNVIDDFRVF